MKALVVHNRYRSGSPGGEDRAVDQETTALVAAGHVVERFERANDDIANWSVARKATIPARVLWSGETRRSLTRALRSRRPDVVHVHNTYPLVSPSVLYACRAERVPVVVTLHNYRLVCSTGTLFRDGAICHDCVGHLPLPAVRHGCHPGGSALSTLPNAASMVVHRRGWRRLVSAYICPSSSVRDIVKVDGLPAARLFVKPDVVPLPPASLVEPGDTVVYAGRLDSVKGIDLLMEAWDIHTRCAGGGRLRLVVMGAGPLEHRVGAWAATRPSVDHLGMVSRRDCASLLAEARAAIVPSAWEEVFGLVAVEAMALGVPSVAAAHGSLPELITDTADGVLFEPGNARALAHVFSDIELHPERFAAMGRIARQTYEQRFTPGANIAQLLRIYQFAIQNPAP